MLNKNGNLCAICGEPFRGMRDITIDHVLPISKGGLDDLSNFQLAHDKCNRAKGCMTNEEYKIFQKGGELVE